MQDLPIYRLTDVQDVAVIIIFVLIGMCFRETTLLQDVPID